MEPEMGDVLVKHAGHNGIVIVLIRAPLGTFKLNVLFLGAIVEGETPQKLTIITQPIFGGVIDDCGPLLELTLWDFGEISTVNPQRVFGAYTEFVKYMHNEHPATVVTARGREEQKGRPAHPGRRVKRVKDIDEAVGLDQ